LLHISLFSGIGGFDLAAEWMGWKNIVSCEINPFCNKILQYYWPEAYHHTDIHTLNYDTINAELSQRFGKNWRNDEIILTGGFPCQPYSNAGKRLGKDDNRHLWPEMCRTIREIKPRWIVGENVYGLVNWSGGLVFHEVQSDLENEGYEVQPYLLPAAAVNAPHQRFRIFFVAYRSDNRLQHTTIGGEQTEISKKQGEQKLEGSTFGIESIKTESIRGTSPDTSSDGYSFRCEETGREDGSSQQGGMQQPSGVCSEQTITNTNNDRFSKQRGYDGSSQNDEGCNPQIIRSADTKNINSSDSSANFIGESRVGNAISRQGDAEKEKPTKSGGFCELDSQSNESERFSENDGHKINNGFSLVQEGQYGVQLSEYTGMAYNMSELKSNGGDESKNDGNNINRMDGVSSYSDGNDEKSNITADRGKKENIWGKKEGDVSGELCSYGYATNTNIRGLEGAEEVGRDGINVKWKSKFGDASNTKQSGLQGCTNTGEIRTTQTDMGGQRDKSSVKFASKDNKSNWQNFPTVSPVCNGDDGLSDRLDSITFPKWRNESIKGGGNAVVPPLIFMIFKTIEEYENKYNNK